MKSLFFVLACFAIVLGSTQAVQSQCWKCTLDPTTPPPYCFLCAANQPCCGDNCYTPACRECNNGAPCGIGGGCFLKGTFVETPNGPRPIEELQIGDIVISDVQGGTSVVTNTYKAVGCGYYLINETIKVTATHPFHVEGMWVNAEDLEVGVQLSGPAGELITVRSIELRDGVLRTYNIEVADSHTFFADGALVHNKDPDPGG